ncbi:C2H2 finger domain-containing protein [Fusarium mexicanum]|uniref:C2H2 finger domain-containing protein n=1 Tax=Fusarium mexicanum TaxID=751941 RepID=A0A8H5IDP5_9HYPO|nr:C2H2 finger domain-containing protein [Fusarium mexicanum]
MDDLERQAKTTISTSKKRFRIGEHRIYALLFLLLIAPSGSRPRALLFLRYGDLELFLARDPEGGPHRPVIRFKLHFTKTFLGDKEVNTMTLPEIFFDSSLLLSPHCLLLGILFHHKAFQAPSLTSPEHLSKLDIHPQEDHLPLPLKQSMDDVFVFRDTVKTGLGGFVLSENKRITYSMIAGWTKDMGVLARFIFTVILYTLRYNAGNEFDSSPSISDGLRNLVLQHANSTPFRKHYLGRVVSVDTMAVVRHTKQQSALIQKACSIGYSASQRRPTELTAEQSAAIDDDPEIQQLLQRRRYLRERNSISPVTRKKLESITKSLQSLRVKLRRERKNEYRAGWSRKQAVVDIEKQLAGHAFDQAPTSSLDESDPFAQEQHPAQKRLVEALTAPVPDTLEGEYRRRDNAVLAVMAYCAVQEPPSLQARKASNIKIGAAFENAEETQASEDIGTAIASVFTKDREERSRRCFLCVGRATTFQPSDPAIERLIKQFYSPGDLSEHFKRHHLFNLGGQENLHCRLCNQILDHKMHLQNHAETVHGTVSRGG